MSELDFVDCAVLSNELENIFWSTKSSINFLVSDFKSESLRELTKFDINFPLAVWISTISFDSSMVSV